MSTQPRIFITDQDYHRLEALVSQLDTEAALTLEDELSRAHITPQREIPSDVVTMNSRVRFVDDVSGQEQEMTLVYPKDANLEEGRISILAPVGVALLGLSVGQSIEWRLPNGTSRRLRVKEVVFQPEAEGNFEL